MGRKQRGKEGDRDLVTKKFCRLRKETVVFVYVEAELPVVIWVDVSGEETTELDSVRETELRDL